MRDTRDVATDLANSQRGMMWLFAAKFALDFSFGLIREMVTQPWQLLYLAVYLVVALTVAYYVFRVVRIIYGVGPAIVCGLLIFAPCIGTLAVLVLNGTTMDRLRKSGINSGFFGANRREMEKLQTLPESTSVPNQNSD